jgi:hypothetical protein
MRPNKPMVLTVHLCRASPGIAPGSTLARRWAAGCRGPELDQGQLRRVMSDSDLILPRVARCPTGDPPSDP